MIIPLWCFEVCIFRIYWRSNI